MLYFILCLFLIISIPEKWDKSGADRVRFDEKYEHYVTCKKILQTRTLKPNIGIHCLLLPNCLDMPESVPLYSSIS